MKKIRFIVNPFSGISKKGNLKERIETHLDLSQFSYELCYTEYAGHAITIAAEAREAGYDMVVVVGGDGSVNEVAQSLIGSDTILAVLPGGSGNGFAMHIGMGRNVNKAIQKLNTGKILTIDTCKMNEKAFVNLAGVGFDGMVANKIRKSTLRGFWAYFKHSIIAAFTYQMQEFEIEIDGKNFKKSCFIFEVANAPMYGYGFELVPTAKFDDGLLEILFLKKVPKWRYLLSGWRFFNKSMHKSSLAESFQAKEVRIKPSIFPIGAHIDGEGFLLEEDLKFTILPASLKVMVDKDY